MNNYKIITDATCDLTTQYFKENDITCLSMSYRINDRDYRFGNDEEGPSLPEFYKLMKTGALPKTAQITSFEATEVFTPYLEQGNDILYLAFSSALSGSCQSVTLAAKELNEKYPNNKVIVIDTLCASLGEGLFVDYAVQNKKNGMNLQDNVSMLESIKQNLCQYFTVDDLHHLHKGGRVSKVAAIVGTILKIKPVLHVSEAGKLIPIAKVKGRRKALDSLVEKMQAKIGSRTSQKVFLSHGDCIEDAEYVKAKIMETFPNITDITIGAIGQVIGTHSGPGTVALFFLGDNRSEKK